MDTIIFFIIINILFSTQIITFNLFLLVLILNFYVGFVLWNFLPAATAGPLIWCLINYFLYVFWFLLIFIKIFFLIYMNKICKKNSLLGKFFDKLKHSLKLRTQILIVVALLDLSMFLLLKNLFTDIVPCYIYIFFYVLLGTGVLLSYISLYLWFDIQKFINFIKKKICQK